MQDIIQGFKQNIILMSLMLAGFSLLWLKVDDVKLQINTTTVQLATELKRVDKLEINIADINKSINDKIVPQLNQNKLAIAEMKVYQALVGNNDLSLNYE